MKFDAPETTQGGGGFLEEVGQYHFVVTEALDGQSSKGTPIDGLTVTFEILAGTTAGQEGKNKQESLFLPSAKDIAKEQKDGTPCMARKKLGALLIATDLMKPEQLGQPVNVNVEDMVGRQGVITFEKDMEMDGEGKYTIEGKYLRIRYSDIFHVDDPAVKAVPKSADALSLIPPERRHKEDWFAWKKNKSKQPRQTASAGASNGSVNAADIF